MNHVIRNVKVSFNSFIDGCMTKGTVLSQSDVLLVSSVMARLTAPSRRKVHEGPSGDNAGGKFGLARRACADPKKGIFKLQFLGLYFHKSS